MNSRLILILNFCWILAACGVQTPSVNSDQATAKMKHSPMPESCAGCHSSKMPAPSEMIPRSAPKISKVFFHETSLVQGLDCVACHSNPAKAGQSFSGAKFTHDTFRIITCNECHRDDMPGKDELVPQPSQHNPNPNLENQFIHSTAYMGKNDCVRCHADNMGKNWTAKFPHIDQDGYLIETCKDCHDNKALAHHFLKSNYLTFLDPDCTTCHNQSKMVNGKPQMTWDRSFF